MDNKRDSGVKSVQMAFDVLEAVAAENGEIGVSELATKLGTTKGTVFRHLQTLVERGYVAQSAASQRYRIGVRSHLLGQSAAAQVDILAASTDAARALREEIGETVVISSIDPRGLTVLTTTLGKSPLEIGVRPGSALELHVSAQGKVALAFSRHPLLPALRKKGLKEWTPHSITDPDALDEEIALVRRSGYARSAEEDTLGIGALAAPILDGGGDAVGTVALVGSIQYIPRDPKPGHLDAILRAAQRISWNLGYTGRIPK